MWAVARYDFQLSDEEFGRTTVPQFWAFWKRRSANFKRQCYLHGITTSATYNVHRTESRQHVFEPMDFVPRTVVDAEREEITLQFLRLKNQMPAAQLPQAKQAWIKKLTELGRTDVSEIMADIFPEDKPNA